MTDAFEMLKTIGEARPGTRMLVCEAFTASYVGPVDLPVGTRLIVAHADHAMTYAIADLGGFFQRVCIPCEQYHKLTVEPKRG